MIEVQGKQVYTELSELAGRDHTALLIVDMQRDFCLPGGAFDRRGIDISMYPPVIPRIARLAAAARAARVPVVHIQMTTLHGRRAESPAQIRFNLRMHGGAEPLSYTAEGSPGHEIVPDLAPGPDDLVVKKYRSSGFWGTNLDLLLRSNGVETVVMAGCTTEGCVESTARDAMFADYYVVVAEDAVASDDRELHDASLILMRRRFDLATTDAIAGVWA